MPNKRLTKSRRARSKPSKVNYQRAELGTLQTRYRKQ